MRSVFYPLNTDKTLISTYVAMKDAGYISSTGKTKFVKRLYENIFNFYKSIDVYDIASFHQIQRIVSNERYNFTTICQIAFYLGISVKDLTSPLLSQKQLEHERSSHYIQGKNQINWQEYDNYLAPILKQKADDIYTGKTNANGRPCRVSERLIYKELSLFAHRLEKLPKCKAIFKQYNETQEENWARRIIWAYNKLSQEKDNFYWSDIRNLSGVKKQNLHKVMPYLKVLSIDIFKYIEKWLYNKCWGNQVEPTKKN